MINLKKIAFMSIVIISSSSLTSAYPDSLNSKCTESQWLNGSKVKFGTTTAQCVAGPDAYYWIDIKQISSSASKEGPLEKKRRTSDVKSAYYLRGYNAIINATQQALLDYSYYKFLNSHNVMTQYNAIDWCNQVLRLISIRTNAVDNWSSKMQVDWEKGCAAAAQKL